MRARTRGKGLKLSDDPYRRVRRTEIVPRGHVVADAPVARVAGRIVAPKHIRRAVAVEVADADHGGRRRRAAEIVPGGHVVADETGNAAWRGIVVTANGIGVCDITSGARIH